MDSMDLGKTDLVKHHIEIIPLLKIGTGKFHLNSTRRYKSTSKRCLISEQLDAPTVLWASPIVLVRRKDGSLTFCIDLRKLNAQTVKDAYSIPRIEDALDSLNRACIFTSLDLKSGNWQVELDEESIPLTAFAVGP